MEVILKEYFHIFTERRITAIFEFSEKFYAAILEEGKTLKKEKEN